MGAPTISVTKLRDEDARTIVSVVVREGSGSTEHEVTVGHADLRRLARPGEATPEFVRRCFEFLLEREPKESILRRFDVTVIGRYFPEWERTIRR